MMRGLQAVLALVLVVGCVPTKQIVCKDTILVHKRADSFAIACDSRIVLEKRCRQTVVEHRHPLRVWCDGKLAAEVAALELAASATVVEP